MSNHRRVSTPPPDAARRRSPPNVAVVASLLLGLALTACDDKTPLKPPVPKVPAQSQAPGAHPPGASEVPR